MPMRRRASRNRFSRSLGLARSFGGEPACSWRCLRDLCGQLAKSLSHHARKVECHPIRRCGRGDDTRLLRSMRHPGCLRTISFASYGECAAGIVQNAHRPTGPLSYRDRRDTGVGLLRRALVTPERISRRGLGSIQAQATRSANIRKLDHTTHKSRRHLNEPPRMSRGSSPTDDMSLAQHFTEAEMPSIPGNVSRRTGALHAILSTAPDTIWFESGCEDEIGQRTLGIVYTAGGAREGNAKAGRRESYRGAGTAGGKAETCEAAGRTGNFGWCDGPIGKGKIRLRNRRLSRPHLPSSRRRPNGWDEPVGRRDEFDETW
jgi:hypothetical protein